MNNVERFELEIQKIKREGSDKLVKYLRTSDMYTAPASTRFHLSCSGGLLQHSLNVLDVLRDKLRKNEDDTYSYIVAGKNVATITEESLIIMTLLHDLCKTHFYKQILKWRKDEKNKWESYDAFEVEDKVPYGHGEKSVMMIEEFMKLKSEERYAIRWHMGFMGDADTRTLGQAIERYPIIWALHSSDMEASQFMEDNQGNKSAYADQAISQEAAQGGLASATDDEFQEAPAI